MSLEVFDHDPDCDREARGCNCYSRKIETIRSGISGYAKRLEDALDMLVFLLDREREGIVAPKNRSSWVPWTPSIDKAVATARRVLKTPTVTKNEKLEAQHSDLSPETPRE